MSKKEQENIKQSIITLTVAEFALISAMLNKVQQSDLLGSFWESNSNSRLQTIGMSQTQFVDMVIDQFTQSPSAFDVSFFVSYSGKTVLNNAEELLGKTKSLKVSESSIAKLDEMTNRFVSAQVTLNDDDDRTILMPSYGELLIGILLSWLMVTHPNLLEDRGNYFYMCLPTYGKFCNNDWLVFTLYTNFSEPNLQTSKVSTTNFALLMWKTSDVEARDSKEDGNQTKVTL